MSASAVSAQAPGLPLRVFNLPDLGEGLTEAELVNWLVAEGDEVAVDQAIAEVETAKSVVEVPSPYAGVVAKLHGRAGETIDVGKPLISVRPAGAVEDAGDDDGAQALSPLRPGAQGSPPQDPPQRSASDSPQGEAYREEERAGSAAPANTAPVEAPDPDQGSGNVLIGYGTPGGLASGRRRRPKSQGSPQEQGDPRAARPHAGPAALFVSPLVRKLARDAGLIPGSIAGTGPDGLVLRRDVEGAIADAEAPTVGDATTNAVESADTDRRSGLAITSRTPVKGVRRTVADNMSRSRREIPEATVWVDVDATALLDMRAALKKRSPEDTPGLLAFLARFVLAGLAKYPQLNTRIVTDEQEGQEILGFGGVNLGIAAQTERGLMVPCVRHAETLSARGLDAEIRRLTAVVRDGKATPAELTSGTFTLNNYGVFGVDGSAAIINHPEAAILGIGRIVDRPWVVDGALAVRKVTELTLTFDHRVCDGGTAGGFLRYVADAIENPGTVLVDL